jgi:hypothetical protein
MAVVEKPDRETRVRTTLRLDDILSLLKEGCIATPKSNEHPSIFRLHKQDGMMELRQKLVFTIVVFGLIMTGAGASLVGAYAVDYNYSHKLVQFAEYWVVARNGMGAFQVGSHNVTVPMGANASDLRAFYVTIDLVNSTEASFWSAVQIFALYSAPVSPVFDTPWLRSAGIGTESNLKLYNLGLETPHNITIYDEEAILIINANDSLSELNLGHYPSTTISQTSEYKGGQLYFRESSISYAPSTGYTFYVANENRTVLHLVPNTDNSWSFLLLARWNTSFQQQYGPGADYAGNATLASWHFTHQSNGSIIVSAVVNNSNYHSPVPVYTVTQRDPWLEVGILGLGIVTSVSATTVLYIRRRPDDATDQAHNNASSLFCWSQLGMQWTFKHDHVLPTVR